MKAVLLFAESAAAHPDSTLTLFRVAITRLTGKALPLHFHGTLVGVVGPDADLTVGSHAFRITVNGPDGEERVIKEEQFEVIDADGGAIIAVTALFTWPTAGKYRATLWVNGVEAARTHITAVIEQPATTHA